MIATRITQVSNYTAQPRKGPATMKDNFKANELAEDDDHDG